MKLEKKQIFFSIFQPNQHISVTFPIQKIKNKKFNNTKSLQRIRTTKTEQEFETIFYIYKAMHAIIGKQQLCNDKSNPKKKIKNKKFTWKQEDSALAQILENIKHSHINIENTTILHPKKQEH